MINNITIDGLVNNLQLKNINVLIGANGSGKSYLLKQIAKQYKDIVYYHSFDLDKLTAFLYEIRQNNYDNYLNIVNNVALILPHFHDFTFKLDNNNRRLYWMSKYSDYIMPSTQLSDGTLRFAYLVAILLQPNPPRTIVIDEPEISLHPYAINILGALLHSVSDNIQIIISTQSVALLDEFDLEDIIIVENHNGKPEYTRINNAKDYEGWLKEYTVSELWYKNILGNYYL